jgi:hypothetical protein
MDGLHLPPVRAMALVLTAQSTQTAVFQTAYGQIMRLPFDTCASARRAN